MVVPHGLCIDLETTITGRVPDKVRPRGQKRYETRLLEIGAIDWKTGKQWGCIVNPLTECHTLRNSSDLFQHLRDIYQKPDATLDFWSSVLVKRGNITPAMIGGESPDIWLRRTTPNRANDFVRWFQSPTKGPAFVSEKQALDGLMAFTHGQSRNTWLAHNGKSFDFKVLSGAFQRHHTPIPSHIYQVDTLHVFRRHIPGYKSYSQPKLYKDIFGHKYNAHVAIDDARALARLCKHVNKLQSAHVSKPVTGKKAANTLQKPTRKQMDLVFGQPYKSKKAGSAKKAMNLKFQKRPTAKPPTTANRHQTLARVLLRKAMHYFK